MHKLLWHRVANRVQGLYQHIMSSCTFLLGTIHNVIYSDVLYLIKKCQITNTIKKGEYHMPKVLKKVGKVHAIMVFQAGGIHKFLGTVGSLIRKSVRWYLNTVYPCRCAQY